MNVVFFDIDGTLAMGKDVPLGAQKAIRQLRMNGSLVWICTGRALKYAKTNFHQYANGYIVSNGREGYTCCAKIFDRPLTAEQIKVICTRLDDIGAGYAFFESRNGHYFGPEEGFQVMSAQWDEGFMVKGGDLSQLRLYNFDIWFKDMAQRLAIEEALNGLCILNPHGNHPTADVTVLGWDKGDALAETAKYLNVPIENTYAFGDGMNDICMLKRAGHGIAMGNGQPALKEMAEFVTSDINEDGVYRGLEHYHLI